MAKELPYFRFTPQEWQNGDISLESYHLKGLFTDIMAFYWVKNCSVTLTMLKKRFRDAQADIDTLIDLGIIELEDNDFISINFLNEQFDMLSEKRLKRQKAGHKGGKQKSSNAKAMLKQKPSYKDKDKDKDKDNKGKTFVPPTLEEVRKYCQQRGNSVDAEKFVNFYESKGWMVGSNKMKSWKSAVITWEKKNGENKQSKTPSGKKKLSV